MRQSTTRPARRPAHLGARRGRGLGSTSNGICHAYTPGRPMRLAAQDPADQLLPLRLRLLHQPPLVQRRAGALHGRRGRGAHRQLLQAQLYRGAVPLLRHRAVARPHDGADDAGREEAAPRGGLCRLHPPQDDPGGEPVADRAGRAVRRPAVDQPRASVSREPAHARAREERRHHRRRHGPDAGAHRRGEGRASAASRPRVRARRSSSAPTSTTDATLLLDQRRALPRITGCAGCTTRPSARFRPPRPCCRSSRRRCSARTACTRPTGCSASMASRPRRSPTAARTACWRWTSIPKSAWALKHRGRFPVDVNTADRELAAARAGARRALGRPHPRRAPPHAAPARRCRPAGASVKRPAALPDRRRLSPWPPRSPTRPSFVRSSPRQPQAGACSGCRWCACR